MKTFLSFIAATVVAGIVSSYGALTIADFEASSGYVSGDLLVGQGGWTGTASARVTPDPSHSGYKFVMAGSQSVWLQAGGANAPYIAFSSVGATGADMYELSWLQALPDSQSASGQAGLWIANAGGSNPMGIMIQGDGTTGGNIFLHGSDNLGNLISVDTTYNAVMGGGGAPTLNRVYRFTMQFDWNTSTMTGFMEDYTNSGSRVNLGSITWNSNVIDSATTMASSFGVRAVGTGGTVGFDDIMLTSIPEPSSVVLLGLAISLFSLARRRQRK